MSKKNNNSMSPISITTIITIRISTVLILHAWLLALVNAWNSNNNAAPTIVTITRSCSIVALFGGTTSLIATTSHNHHPSRSTNNKATLCWATKEVEEEGEVIDNEGECGATTTIVTHLAELSPVSAHTTSTISSLSRKPISGDVVTFTLLRFQPALPLLFNHRNDETIIIPSLEESLLFDTTGKLQLVVNGGNYLPGLHHLLSTMTPGEVLQDATIDAGYGEYNPNLVFELSKSSMQDSIDTSLVNIGTVFQMDNNGMECRVIEIHDNSWTLDANPIFAGATYEVDIKLEKVEEGPTYWEYMKEDDSDKTMKNTMLMMTMKKGKDKSRYKVATFALGCFWGGELAYQRIPGVISTHVGYTQGHKVSPTYEEVCTGTTGHTEAIRMVYDPNVVSYESLVQVGLDRLGDNIYLLNQVGNDRGTQYRHGIYFHDDEQKRVAEELLRRRRIEGREVMTELKEASIFFMAEEYHQQYLMKGGQSAKKGADETIRCYG